MPTLAFTGDAQGILTFQMKRVSQSAYLNPSMTGYLGAAFDFSTAGKMEKAELAFCYDEKLLGEDTISQESFSPTIYYYNEETGLLEEVEGQVWKGTQVTTTLSHFSTYILANKADLEALWERTKIVDNTLIKGEKKMKETMFVWDCSYLTIRSGGTIDRCADIILNYINYHWEDGETLVFKTYGMDDSWGEFISLWEPGDSRNDVRDKFLEEIKGLNRRIESIFTYELSTSFSRTALRAISYWSGRNALDTIPAQRNMYWLTDGSFIGTSYFVWPAEENIIKLQEYSNEYDYTCHVIGFGNDTEKIAGMTSMAKGTGGDYYQYDTNFDINRCYQETQPEQPADGTDQNNDGLNDELEKKICDGEITTISGTTIFSPDSYDKLMESDDYDGDGLKNGEEIEIYQYRKATYFRLKSLPYIYDSDCDGYSDYEEVKEMNTPPCKANFVMKYSDVSYLNNTDQFESVKAFNKYMDSKGIGNVAVKSLDVIFCGGELNLNKAMSKELAKCLAEDAKENEKTALAAGIADVANTYVAGLVALLPEIHEKVNIAGYVDDYVESVNNLQKAIKVLEQDGDSQELLRTLRTNLQNHRNTWKSDLTKLNEKGAKIKNYGKYATFAMGVASSTADEINEWTEYYAHVSQLVGYRDVLQRLSHCRMENVEVAAKKILKELDGEYGKHKLYVVGDIGSDLLINLAKYFLSEGLKKISPYIALADITAGIVLGDSMSVALQNSISVNIALELSILSNKMVTGNIIRKDCAGNTQVVYDDASNYLFARKLWLSTIHTIKRCEENYQSYIFSDKSLELNRKMLYFTQDSIMNVTNNLIELLRMHNQYAM